MIALTMGVAAVKAAVKRVIVVAVVKRTLAMVATMVVMEEMTAVSKAIVTVLVVLAVAAVKVVEWDVLVLQLKLVTATLNSAQVTLQSITLQKTFELTQS